MLRVSRSIGGFLLIAISTTRLPTRLKVNCPFVKGKKKASSEVSFRRGLKMPINGGKLRFYTRLTK
jgi:hypothetical protein